MSRFVRYLPLAIGSLAFLIATSSAFADRFQDLDSNQDGVLSGNEAQWLISFDTEPVGKPDGEVTRKEFSAGLARFLKTPINPEERFQARNTNRDDRLSGTELSGYEYTDLDGNGRVTQKEFAEGLQRDQAKRATMPIEELTAEGKRRFDGLDLNRDQRLSGLEMTGMATADFNNDRRLSLEEFMASLLLDTANEPTSVPPASRTASENPLQTVINAVNRHDGSAIYAMFRPELAQIVDAVLFEYVVGFVAQSHGTLAMPSKDLITVNDQGLNGKKLVSLMPRCQKGKLEIELTVLTNQLLGIAFNSPEIDQLNDHLFSDLFADKDGLLGKFAQAYSSQCTLMIQHVLDAKFSDAYAMLHPEVQEKIGLDRFTVVFQRLREICGDDPTKIELETAGVELDAQGKGVFFTISHRVTGSQGTALFQHKMQFVGLKAHFVAVSVESAPDEAVPPPAPPVPASPVPAPPVLAPKAIPPSPIGAAPPPFSDVIAPPK